MEASQAKTMVRLLIMRIMATCRRLILLSRTKKGSRKVKAIAKKVIVPTK